jgi:hypothetical protein
MTKAAGTQPSEMIEFVGSALAQACMERFGSTWSNDVRWKFARVAIEAMRKPTWHMLLDGQKQVNLSEVAGEFEFLSRDEIERIWSEMIDTALRD